ncbi:hypothetical protein J1N35_044021, partial [Gossypium stocksii]
ITSFIGIAEQEEFYQQYKIWVIKTMFEGTNLSSVNEDKEHLSKIIDMCYNDFSHYQFQVGIDLMIKAQWKKNTGIQHRKTSSRDEEFVQLLKKITDMEIDDYPLTMEIKDTWESWNSPAPLPNSLHLDDIEKMNLTNIQEG